MSGIPLKSPSRKKNSKNKLTYHPSVVNAAHLCVPSFVKSLKECAERFTSIRDAFAGYVIGNGLQEDYWEYLKRMGDNEYMEYIKDERMGMNDNEFMAYVNESEKSFDMFSSKYPEWTGGTTVDRYCSQQSEKVSIHNEAEWHPVTVIHNYFPLFVNRNGPIDDTFSLFPEPSLGPEGVPRGEFERLGEQAPYFSDVEVEKISGRYLRLEIDMYANKINIISEVNDCVELYKAALGINKIKTRNRIESQINDLNIYRLRFGVDKSNKNILLEKNINVIFPKCSYETARRKLTRSCDRARIILRNIGLSFEK